MTIRISHYLAFALVVSACAGEADEPVLGEVTQGIDIVFNGSFESNYAGWTLLETPSNPSVGIFGIGSDGSIVGPSQIVFDFADNVDASSGSPGLPLTIDATAGALAAFNLQNGPQNHRMFQTVTLPACQPLLQWDMLYKNHNNLFDPASQYTAVHIRDVASDAILATPFQTGAADPLTLPAMTPFQVDLTQFSGQTVRLDFDHQVQSFFFDVVWDNIRIVCKGLSASPGTLDFGTVPVGTTTAPQTTTITNFAATPLTISSLAVTGPYQITGAPALPLTLNPGATTTASIAFRPTIVGPGNGTLTLNSNDPNGATQVALFGNAIDAAVLTVTPSQVAFGTVQVGEQRTQTVTLSNTGTSVLTIIAAFTSPDFVVDTTGMASSLAPGASTTVTVRFAPTITGPVNGTLTIDSSANTQSIPLSGTGVTAQVLADPASLAFGNQRVGTTTTPRVVRVTNTGVGTVTLSSTTISGPFARGGPALPLALAPGTSADFSVTFSPTAIGAASGQLTIATSAGTLATPLSGTGVAPGIAVNPPSVVFADTRVGTTSTRAVVVTNTGTDTLRIQGASALPPFAASLPPNTLVPPGGSVSIDVAFTPAVPQLSSGTLTITSDASPSPTAVPLSGRGVEPLVAVSPATLAFGNQRVGTTSATQTITVTNPGNLALVVSSVTVAPPFAITTATSFQVPPGGTATIRVAFSPTAGGSVSRALTIQSDARSSPTIVTCTGTGVDPLIAVSPPALSFGDVRTGTTSTAQTVTVANPGTTPLTISSITAPAGFSFTSSALPIGVLPGASTSIAVKFAPTADGPAGGSLVIASNAAGSPSTVALSGTGVSPRIALSPATHAFGDVRVGTTSPPATLSIQNPGNVTLTITGITVPAPFVATLPALPAQIAPGGSLAFGVAFAPTARSSITRAIAIASDAAPVSASVSGRGVAPVIAATPNPLELGTVAIGSSSNRTLQIANTGDAPLVVSALSISGAQAADFSLASPPALPATLAPGGTLAVVVAFGPTDHGTRSAQLVIASDALGTPLETATLRGAGNGPRMALTPATLDLGATNVDVPTAPRNLVVANTGETPLVVTSIALGGAHAADFESTATLPLTVAPGASATLPFVFTPSAVGARTATATVVSDDPLAPTASSTLTGTGESPVLAVSPASVAFGDVGVGDASTLQVVLRNTGTGTLAISSVQLSGAGASQLQLGALALPLVLAPGASRTLSITYVPAVLGSVVASLDVLSDDPSGALAVPISGAGVSATLALSATALDFGGQLVGRPSDPREVRIQNTGSGPLVVHALAFAGPQAASFSLASPPVLPASIAAGGELALAVRLTPSAVGAAAAQLVIGTDAPDSPTATVDVTGLGISTALAITPTTIDFGTTRVPSQAAAVPVTLTNLTSDPIELVDATLAGPRAGDFTVTSTAGTVPPGGSVTAMVSYTAAMPATSAATIAFRSTDAAIPDAVVTVSGKAVSAFLVADRPVLELGAIQVGDRSGPRSITVTNVSTAPVTIARIAASDASFEVDPAAALVELAPGASASFTIAFVPATTGPIAGEVTITLAGATTPELAIALAGEGTAPPDAGGCSSTRGTRGAAWWLVALAAALLSRRRRPHR